MFQIREPYAPSIACIGPVDGEPPSGTDPAWVEWWRQNRRLICGGEEAEVPVPASLPHPARSGFSPTSLAEAVGQVRNWALPLSDGSRLHIHEFSDKSMRVHRDATDPGRGLTSAVWHWMTESITGRVVVAAGLIFFVGSHVAARAVVPAG